ncbi:hypothetical protein NC653_002009 [Populus alba x Populus x berolinensis]|uniref:F-box protein At3g26010-like beta-propeller domain-containing protein n=1 Tax=Populus alba x Populus x berolinensis TaxID=444605 RepID=A0AAD6RMM3_9ROSI|nr:hypothetical protein NC653_002009 [Populus alba x Populus x berolinensis]
MEAQMKDCSENPIIISDMGTKGLLSHYQFEDGSSQFIFLDIDKETGGISINNPLSLTTGSYVQIISSSEGLLLLSSTGENQVNYLVFNPLTKQSVTLPQHGIARLIIRSGLAFDGKHYQVVLVHVSRDEENGLGPLPGDIELEIFSSETGAWRNHRPFSLSLNVELPENEFPELNTTPLFSNGAIHWEISGQLLVYHVEDDCCEVIELPNVFEDWSWQSTMTYRRCLWESEGRVHYTYTDFDGVHSWNLLKEDEHNVYSHQNVYDREKFRWQLAYTINHEDLTEQDPDILSLGDPWEPRNISPIAYVQDSETMYLQLPGVVVAYDTKNRVLLKVCRYTFPGVDFNCCSFFPSIHISECNKQNASNSQVGEVVDLPIGEELIASGLGTICLLIMRLWALLHRICESHICQEHYLSFSLRNCE